MKIQDVVLELVRPGPAHNQLLSPLTPYVALCGGDSPVSVHMPFEHQQLLTRIQRLRYELETGSGSEAQIAQRQAELHEMGTELGDVLGDIPTLLAELSRVRCEGEQLTHLRLSFSASELGMVPFETAISPAGFPGSGSPLFLQSKTPVTVTREIRRGRPLALQWNQTPRILFVFASPPGLAPVPAEAHLRAIRKAITPWIKIRTDLQQRIDEVKAHLTVLPDASLQEIRDECSREHYTHIHILAHGAPFTNAGDRNFGIALCCNSDKTKWEVIDGESLAIALTGKSAAGETQHTPSVVSLATCDSGNISSVLSPGGSIAHGLHSAGIPWVIASQFPLWMKASTFAVEELFVGLLSGEDPRSVLYNLRRRLRTDCPGTHDWASIVAYATLPSDFENQLSHFRDRQIRSRLSVRLNRLDYLFGSDDKEEKEQISEAEKLSELGEISKTMRAILADWRKDLPTDPEQCLNPVASDRFGMSGANEKRLGVAYMVAGKKDDALNAYKASRDFYCLAIEANPTSTWPLTQYLSMNAVLALKGEQGRTPLGISPGDWWFIATRLATSQVDNPRGAFALTDLVELSLLGCFYNKPCNLDETRKEIEGYIKKIHQLEYKCSVPKTALLRQLKRYLRSWGHEDWNGLVEDVIAELDTEKKI